MLGDKSAAMTLATYAVLFDDDLDAVAMRLDHEGREKSVGKVSALRGHEAYAASSNQPNFRVITRIWRPPSDSKSGGEWGIRTPEGFHPTRFPSVRHRPLGEFSWPAIVQD
jgi:hypothetical protein